MLSKYLEYQANLDNALSRMDSEKIAQLYLRVFNTEDGKLVLKDLANRCYVDTIGSGEVTEGMRSVYLTIISRINEALTGKKKESKDE